MNTISYTNKWIFLVAVIFLLKSFLTIPNFISAPLGHPDAGSEWNSSVGAQSLVNDGFFKSAGLPNYGFYNKDSPSKVIRESPYYCHYFPGPDYVLYIVYSVFGFSEKTYHYARVIPLLHVTIAVVFLSMILGLLLNQTSAHSVFSFIPAIFAAFILFSPAMRIWALNLHGHAYSSSYIIMGISLGILATLQNSKKTLYIVAIIIGFLSNYMLLTGCFVVCFSPILGACLSSENFKAAYLSSFKISFFIGLGLILAFFVHLYQVAHLFGWAEAWLDQLGTAAVRGGENAIPLEQLFGKYNEQVYGFFGISSLSMALISFVVSYCSNLELQKKKLLAISSTLSGVVAFFWIISMKSHASGHLHVNPRIFLIQYVIFLSTIAICLNTQRQKI